MYLIVSILLCDVKPILNTGSSLITHTAKSFCFLLKTRAAIVWS